MTGNNRFLLDEGDVEIRGRRKPDQKELDEADAIFEKILQKKRDPQK